MDAEIFLNKDKLVVSKLGFDAANPSLSEGDKLFDSDWLFSGTVVAAGIHVDQASYRNPKRGSNISGTSYIAFEESTNTSTPQYIRFAPLPFIPTVMLLPLCDSRYWADHRMVLLGADKLNIHWPNDYQRVGEITVDHEKITIPRPRYKNTSGDQWYFREDFIYLIMAM